MPEMLQSGIIKPRAILRIADEIFTEQIQALIHDAGLSCDDVQLRERRVHVSDSPRPSGIISVRPFSFFGGEEDT
jgi:hypothetical protein